MIWHGQIIGIDQNGSLQSYQYDQLGRLTGADTTRGQYAYQYDPVGNRTEKQHTDQNGNTDTEHYTYAKEGEGNRLLAVEKAAAGQTESLAYNEAGSPTRARELSYEYNRQQRPTKVYRTGNSTQNQKQLIAEYTYNRFGERIKKVVYSHSKKPKVTYYLYDGHSLTAEADESGKITAQYLYYKNQPFTKLEGKQPYAIHTDHLGTPRAATDSKGKQVWQADYSPFGQANITTQQITINLRFPGQYEDVETGKYYNYLRTYDPDTGRYATSDPIGLKGGINTYAYVSGNPLSGIDPLGLYRLVIGIERPDPTAIDANGILDLNKDTGHTFIYAVDDRNIITHAVSFGPLGSINGLKSSIGVPGTADFPLQGNASLFSFDITKSQYIRGTFWIDQFRKNVPQYRLAINQTCTAEAVDIINGWTSFNVNIPSGKSKVKISLSPGRTFTTNAINPHGLYQGLLGAGHTPTVVNTDLLVVDTANPDPMVGRVLNTGVRDPLLPPNSSPTVVNDNYTHTAPIRTPRFPLTMDVLGNDADVDGDRLTITSVSSIPISDGTLQIRNNKIIYVPAIGASGTVRFTYTVSNSHGGVSTATVDIIVK